MDKHIKKYIAGGLIIASFLLYLLLPVLPMLHVSGEIKFGLFIGLQVISWGIFFVGTAMGGKEVWKQLKKCMNK